ncbi:MAG: M23 family metallopeptidase, partial [Halioglobus sp.]|nr:M23 family metallopeptidase [Halioglobus sp.]
PGDLVRKGDPIALIGSTGRSTGNHVHYEVYKHGRSVDPSSYVHRTRR